MQRLWDEIRRRNLHRVTAAYAVIAWIVAQAAGLVFPTFGMPTWALQLLIIVLVVALPVLWVVLWLANAQPAGVIGGDGVPRRPIHHTEWALIGLLVAVLAATIVEFVWSPFGSSTRAVATAAAPTDASIAVLAFNNMSGDPNNEYFSEGISEDLLNDLSQIRGLRVAARTSSFSFRGKNVTVGDIGRALNVRAVVEGSVQRQGNRVRITAQLINAADGYHMWSQTYDRDLTDIFAVQDEICRAITKELTGRLLGTSAGNPTARAPIDPDAYTAYLQGRFYLSKRDKADMERAIAFFKTAIGLEPNYQDAHTSLALTYAILLGNGQRRDTLRPAQDEIAAALKLDPDNQQTIIANAFVAITAWNFDAADAAFRLAIRRHPNDADAHHFYGDLLVTLGLFEAAIAEQKRAEILDPLSAVPPSDASSSMHVLHRDKDAVAEAQRSLALDPNLVFPLLQMCQSDADLGKLDEAKTVLRDRLVAVDGEDGPFAVACRATIAARSNDTAELKRVAALGPGFYASGDMLATNVAFLYALAGDRDAAFHWLDQAVATRDVGLVPQIFDPDWPAAITHDPRWTAMLQQPLLRDWRAAHDRVAAELATAAQTGAAP